MAFASILSPFGRFLFVRERMCFIIGTVQYVERVQKMLDVKNTVLIDIDNLSLITDPIAISSLIFQKSLPDLIDEQTKFKALFCFVLSSILSENDDTITESLQILEGYFNITYRESFKEQIEGIFPSELYNKCLKFIDMKLYNLVQIYMPIKTQIDLSDTLEIIASEHRKNTQNLIRNLRTEDEQDKNIKLISGTGRVKVDRGNWLTYKILMNRYESIPDELLPIVQDLQSRVMSADEPFFELRNRVFKSYNNLNLEYYLKDQTTDFDNLKLSISVSTTYSELWFYAVKMKGLIFELISSYYIPVWKNANVRYKAESEKLPLSMILGSDMYDKLIKVLSNDFQTVDPVPDFYYIKIDETGNICYYVVEVGWWTDSLSKLQQEEEKWAPFLKAASDQKISLYLETFVMSSRSMELWPDYITKNKVLMSWVNVSKNVFRNLMMTPEDEEEIEMSILTSTEVRRLVTLRSKVICPITKVDCKQKQRSVVEEIKRSFELLYSSSNKVIINDVKMEPGRISSFVKKLDVATTKEPEVIYNLDDYISSSFDVLQSNIELVDLPVFDDRNKRIAIVNEFIEEENALNSERTSIQDAKSLSIFNMLEEVVKNTADYYNGDNIANDIVFNKEHSLKSDDSITHPIDYLLRMPFPGRTSRQKRIRKYLSIYNLRFMMSNQTSYYVDRIFRVSSVKAAHQNVGGKVDYSKLVGFDQTIVEMCKNMFQKNISVEDTLTYLINKLNYGEWSAILIKIIYQIIEYTDTWLTELLLNTEVVIRRWCLVITNNIFLLGKFLQEGIVNATEYMLDDENRILFKGSMAEADFFEDLKDDNPNNGNNEIENKETLHKKNEDELLIGNINAIITLKWEKFINGTEFNSARNETVINEVYELLGHKSLEEQKVVMTDRMIGKNYSRNNPSIKIDIEEVLAYFELESHNELSNFGAFVLKEQKNREFSDLVITFENFIAKSKKDLDYKNILEINLYYEVFYVRLDESQFSFFNIHVANCTNIILTLLCYQRFIKYLLLSTIAKTHLELNSKYNGLKEHSISSIKSKLYIMQPDLKNDSMTPAVLVTQNNSKFRFNLDFVKSKLWVSLPYMIVLTYTELSQEYGVYNQQINFDKIYNVVIDRRSSTSSMLNKDKSNTISKNSLSSIDYFELDSDDDSISSFNMSESSLSTQNPDTLKPLQNYIALLEEDKITLAFNFEASSLVEYLNSLIDPEELSDDTIMNIEYYNKRQNELEQKVIKEKTTKISEKSGFSMLKKMYSDYNLKPEDLLEDRLSKRDIYRTRSRSTSSDGTANLPGYMITDRLINGLLNFLFWPAIYNNKYNNEFRQALRYIYAGINSLYQNTKIGKKYSHITRYKELYIDKIIGLYTSHQDNIVKKQSFKNLTGPCWLGCLPIINNNVLTTCMFICHSFNKVISNYDESLLKTMDGTFEIPFELLDLIRNEHDVVDDLVLGTQTTDINSRVRLCLSDSSNKSFLVAEFLNIGMYLLKDKLMSTNFRGLEYSRGLHNNFMDIAEVTNCISSPKKNISLLEISQYLINQKFNKMIKFASNRRNKFNDKSFIDAVLDIADEQFKTIPSKVDELKKYITNRNIMSKKYSVDFEIWCTDNNNEQIINSFKILLKNVNTSLKLKNPNIFKSLKESEWPAHLDILKNLYESVQPDYKINLKINFDEILIAEKELEILYIQFDETKKRILNSSKYLSQVGVRSTLTDLEEQFRLRFKKEINDWFKFLLNCASISPVALLSTVKTSIMTQKILSDKILREFNYQCFNIGPSVFPRLTRYISGCICGKVKLSQTNFTILEVGLDEIGSAIRTFYHNSSTFVLYDELCKLYIMIAQGNWKTGQRLLFGWKNRGLPRSLRNKVIFESLRASNLYNSHNVAAVAFNIIKRENWSYFAGLAPKAQLGGLRDLLVQDFESKVVLHVSEQMALGCLESLSNDILGHPDAKDYALKRMTEYLSSPETKDSCVFICGDKKKWAQKHSTLFFYKLVESLFDESGAKNFLKMVMLEGLKKEIEIPSPFTSHYFKKIIKDPRYLAEENQIKLLIHEHMGTDIKKYHKFLLNSLMNGRNYIQLFSHMGQGIHHKFSSLYGHAAELVSILMAKLALKNAGYVTEVEYFRSSDDYTQLLLFKKDNVYAKGEKMLKLLSTMYFQYYTATMQLCNIRESEKTIITTKFGEIYSTYASIDVIPAPFKYYIPNVMISSAFTPLDIWRTKFAKMQQMFDNGMSLVGIFNYALLENALYQRFVQISSFEHLDSCCLPNTTITFIPFLSDVVFGTLSNTELKIIRNQIIRGNLNVKQIGYFTEFFHEIDTKKSKTLYDMNAPNDSMLKEIYSLPYSKKYEKMKKMVTQNLEDEVKYRLNKLDKNTMIINDENAQTLVVNLITRSSKTDSVAGEEIRFKLALNSKGIIWGLSGGTREESINMLRQVTSHTAYYSKAYRSRFRKIYDLATKSSLDNENIEFSMYLGGKIIKETIDFDKSLSMFRTRYFDISSITTPMRKLTHWNTYTKFKLMNDLEQVLGFIIDQKTFLELKPRVNRPELLETDVRKIEAFLGMKRGEIRNSELLINDLLLRCSPLKKDPGGTRSSIMIVHYEDDWKDIPKASLMYNCIHHWIIESQHEIYYPSSGSEKIYDFCVEILSAIAFFSGTEYCKRSFVKSIFSLPSFEYPKQYDLTESLLATVMRHYKLIDPKSRIKKDFSSLLSLLLDNLLDSSIDVHREFEEKRTTTVLSTSNLGTFTFYTVFKEDGYCSLILRDYMCVIKTDVIDTNLLQYILELVRLLKDDPKLTITDAIKFIVNNYDFNVMNDLMRLYSGSRFVNPVSILKIFIDTAVVIPNWPKSNLNILFSTRPELRSFSVKGKATTSQYLYIDANSWKKLQLTVRKSNINEQAVLIEDIIKGTAVGKFEDLRIINKILNVQWISKATINFINKVFDRLNLEILGRLGQELFFKLRSSQLLKSTGSKLYKSEQWDLQKEEFLNIGGKYFYDDMNLKVVASEQSSTLKNTIKNVDATIHRLNRDDKIPAFFSPYICISDNFETLRNYCKTFLRILTEENYIVCTIIIRILKLLPQSQFPNENIQLYKKINKQHYTFLFDLPVIDEEITIVEILDIINVEFKMPFEKFSRLAQKLLNKKTLNIVVSPEKRLYTLQFQKIIDTQELFNSMGLDKTFVFSDNIVSFPEFIDCLLQFTWNILNPIEEAYYLGFITYGPLFDEFDNIFTIRQEKISLNSILNKSRSSEPLGLDYIKSIVGENFPSEGWIDEKYEDNANDSDDSKDIDWEALDDA